MERISLVDPAASNKLAYMAGVLAECAAFTVLSSIVIGYELVSLRKLNYIHVGNMARGVVWPFYVRESVIGAPFDAFSGSFVK